MIFTEYCYVVNCSAGSYEDYRTNIVGIFPDIFSAEQLKDEIVNRVEFLKNTPCPFDEKDLEFLTEKQKSIYYKWLNEINDALEFNYASIDKYPFGKSLLI